MPSRKIVPAPLPAGSTIRPTPSDAFYMVSLDSFGTLPAEFLSSQQALYAMVLAQAQLLLRPSLIERDWLGHWN